MNSVLTLLLGCSLVKVAMIKMIYRTLAALQGTILLSHTTTTFNRGHIEYRDAKSDT